MKLFYLELETDKENRPFECDILCDPPVFSWCWSIERCDDFDLNVICIGTACASTNQYDNEKLIIGYLVIFSEKKLPSTWIGCIWWCPWTW